MICLILFLVSVLFGEGETLTYKPTDIILIDCGATSNNQTDGRTWTPEQTNILASNLANASFTSMTSTVPFQFNAVPSVRYQTARIFRSSFTYSISVSPGWKFLRLHFNPTRSRSGLDANNSSFSVTVNGITLLKNFTPVKDPFYGYVIKEFIVPVLDGHNKTLSLTLTPSPQSLAFLNGLEIVSMPDRFYTKGGFDGYVKNVGSNIEFEIDNTTVLETVYRLNVGGSIIDDVNDTGMFRRWLSDGSFLLGDTSKIPTEVGVKINYTEKTPDYVAPEKVYTTFIRSTGKTEDGNLTWLFPVDAGFNYIVRLHFCVTMFDITKPNQQLFNIIIGNQIAKYATDVFNMSGGPNIPLYLDFSIFMASNGSKSLRLDLAPNRFYYDAFLNGVKILKLNDSHGNLAAGPNLNQITLRGAGKLHVLVKILIALGSAIGVAITLIVVFMLMKRKNRKYDNSVTMFKNLLKEYTYAELKKITKSFSRTLGKGGFGTVYRGNLRNGRKVAVKVLKDLKGNGEDFINEVASMSQTSHVNIVSLLGFCNEGSKRAIVYELLENGSLDQFISRKKSSNLDLTTIYGIALGIARGLEYLHYGCRTRIVHFDIKPQNILLDGSLCPKVSDFGLAKLCEKRQSIMSLIDARGTIGYIAPEVFSRTYGGVSHKSDVYSYGMLVLEMIGARNKTVAASNASTSYFPHWIYKDFENGEQTWRFGEEITGNEKETAKKMILVGLWCIQPCPIDRPPMNRVVEMMEGSLDALEVPPNPSMHISTRFMTECSSLSDSGKTDNNSELLRPAKSHSGEA